MKPADFFARCWYEARWWLWRLLDRPAIMEPDFRGTYPNRMDG